MRNNNNIVYDGDANIFIRTFEQRLKGGNLRMEKRKTMTARRGTRMVISLTLVMAMLASLFALTFAMAESPYVVTFDANGGSWGNKVTTKQISGTSVNHEGLDDAQLETLGEPTREGYTFEGWGTVANSDRTNVNPDVYDPERSITVYAIWYKLIDIAFDDQQGNVIHIYKEKGESLNVETIPQPHKLKNGLVFSGWYTDKECTSEAINYGVMKAKKDTTFYAGYSEGYSVTLIGNGGHFMKFDGELTTRLTIYVQKGKKMPAIIPLINQHGKFFAGYFTDPGFKEETRVKPGDRVTSDLTLYTKWDDCYIMTFKVQDENGCWVVDGFPSFVAPGMPFISRRIPVTTKAGAEFVGWYTDKALTQKAPAFDKNFIPTDDCTFYAKYDEVVSYNLKYFYSDDNAELRYIEGEDECGSYVKHRNSVLGFRNQIPDEYVNKLVCNDKLNDLGIDFFKEGISTNWYLDKAHTVPLTATSDLEPYKDANGDVNVYGYKVKRTMITLITNRGKIFGPTAPGTKMAWTFPANVDSSLKKTAEMYTVQFIKSRNPMKFKGWVEDPDEPELLEDVKIAHTRTLYAWLVDAYSITFDMNTGYIDIFDYKQNQFVRNIKIDTVVEKGQTIESTLDGWKYNPDFFGPYYYGDKDFMGWATDAEGKNMIDPKTYVPTDDVIIYAIWERYGEDEKPEPQPTPTPDTKLNGLVQGPDGKWAMYKNGVVDTGATGIFQNENGWWRVENGYVNFNAQGIYQNKHGWWKTTNGKVTFKETGVFQNKYGWWRVENSKVNFNAQSIYQNKYGWWKTTNGKVTFKENGVYQNKNGWWKTKDSKVDFKFTGIASNKNGNWYLKNGKVDFKKNGKVKYNGKTYIVTNGKAKLA